MLPENREELLGLFTQVRAVRREKPPLLNTNNTIEQMHEIYTMLEDKQSKDIYRSRLNYLLTGDYSYAGQMTEPYHPGVNCRPYKSVDEIMELVGERPIILYGAGGDADYFRSFWEKLDRDKIIGFCDKNEAKQKTGYLGYPVISPDELAEHDDAVILIMSSSREEEIAGELVDSGILEDRIVRGIFPVLRGLRGMYFDTDIVRFEDGEVFVDAGSYDLSTAVSLRNLTKVKKVYAFEADPDNVPKCQRRKEETGFSEAEIYPYGLWSKKDILTFGSTGDTNAGFYQEGVGRSVEVRALDDIIDPGERVTFIKMDIEGSELEALKGSRRIIQSCKPKLAICIYHKPEDMYELPTYIKELVPEYRLYLRHYSNRAHETVLYAV